MPTLLEIIDKRIECHKRDLAGTWQSNIEAAETRGRIEELKNLKFILSTNEDLKIR